MTESVYITKTANFLPNNPVSNDEIEEYMGLINGRQSKSKRIVLRNNGIQRRFYAMMKDGTPTHTNAEMTSLAIRKLFEKKSLSEIELLACGTSTPDQMMPSHACMVHGWLPESPSIEVVSPSGVCCSGMHALKYVYMSVKQGYANTAVATGSERLSRVLRSEVFEEEMQRLESLEDNPYISFEKDFLRWMLSDGAAAFKIQNKPDTSGLNLRIDWLTGASYANEIEPCMYMAGEKQEGGILKSYMDYTPREMIEQSILSMKQDVKLLGEHIVEKGGIKLKEACDKNGFDVKNVDYFLPHMSSEFFRMKIAEKLEENGMGIPQEKWFSNLTTLGNVGAASIYLMIDELFNSGKLQKGNKILLLVPESSRFSYMYGLLTVC
ncbi:MAG TPA: beta-ketoacyl-ACP synthase III [Cyclobacteriaceae bacterium]|jgi:3-oxoacyl-[acyl-carrier-protein] synthase-3